MECIVVEWNVDELSGVEWNGVERGGVEWNGVRWNGVDARIILGTLVPHPRPGPSPQAPKVAPTPPS